VQQAEPLRLSAPRSRTESERAEREAAFPSCSRSQTQALKRQSDPSGFAALLRSRGLGGLADLGSAESLAASGAVG
jgi:hypothetical protein